MKFEVDLKESQELIATDFSEGQEQMVADLSENQKSTNVQFSENQESIPVQFGDNQTHMDSNIAISQILQGVGIERIEKTTTEGQVDTYVITLTNGKTYSFTVTNGTDGKDGANGKDGLNGADGVDGKDGANGIDGEDGKDGTSVTVISVEESTEDGGSNIVKFSDGKTLTVKNGSKGSQGEKGETGANGADGKDGTNGKDGANGANGADGVGIANIAKTTTDGKVDTYTITLTNGKTYSFTVTNGTDGKNGNDYVLTDDDKTEIAEKAKNLIDLSVYQTKEDENLETESKEIVGAINEINAKLKEETFVLNDTPTFTTAFRRDVNFTSNGVKYTSIATTQSYNGQRYYWILHYNNMLVYSELSGWADDKYKTVTLADGIAAVDTDVANFINTNGNIVGGGDTSNLATVDKIGEIYTHEGDTEIAYADDSGMAWAQTFGIYDDDGETIKNGNIYPYIPLVAGNNIEFKVDEEHQVVKINATGGGSTPSMIGTWTIIENPEIPTTEIPLSFTSNGETFVGIGFSYVGSSSWNIRTLVYLMENGEYFGVYTNNPSGNYGIPHGWGEGISNEITITEEPTDPNTIAWLGASTNAPKVTPSKPCLEMPQIRFTSANGCITNTSTFYVDDENPLKLTVEIVGGGALQVGDALQVCIRKRFNGSTANGFKRKYKLQRFAEYVVTEEDLNKRFLTVHIFLQGEGGRAYRGLFRNGNCTCLSPLYLRIRRPKGKMQTNNSGQTVDAEFSNIVTIWKHTLRGYQAIRIQ